MDNPSPTSLFDPLSIEDVQTGTLRVRDETGAPTSWVITLAGPEHPERKRRLFARQRRLRGLVAKTGKMPVSDPEEDEAEQLDNLTACVLGWEGSVLPFSPQTVRQLLSDSKRRWLRDQISEALEERELFTRRSAAT